MKWYHQSINSSPGQLGRLGISCPRWPMWLTLYWQQLLNWTMYYNDAICLQHMVSHGGVHHIDRLVQQRHNSSALAMELHLSCSNPSICGLVCQKQVSRTVTSNYIPQILWDVITFPCPWYLHLTQSPHIMSVLIILQVCVSPGLIQDISISDHPQLNKHMVVRNQLNLDGKF